MRLLWVGVLLAGCEPVEPSGHPFTPVPAERAARAGAPVTDPLLGSFEDVQTLKLSSEQLTKGSLSPAAGAGVDASALPGGDASALSTDPGALLTAPAEALSAAPAGVAATAVPVLDNRASGPVTPRLTTAAAWPVRLVATLPSAQPPRAVLGLPTGEERVVYPGSILAEQQLVVMSVTAGKVQLAKVVPAGDHAVIEPMELAAQYP